MKHFLLFTLIFAVSLTAVAQKPETAPTPIQTPTLPPGTLTEAQQLKVTQVEVQFLQLQQQQEKVKTDFTRLQTEFCGNRPLIKTQPDGSGQWACAPQPPQQPTPKPPAETPKPKP